MYLIGRVVSYAVEEREVKAKERIILMESVEFLLTEVEVEVDVSAEVEVEVEGKVLVVVIRPRTST